METPREVGIAHLTLLDVSPPDLVLVAWAAGFDSIGVRVRVATRGEEPWPMAPGSPLLKETALRLADTGIQVLDIENVAIQPGLTRSDYEVALESGARLGARYLIVNSADPDLERTADTCAAITEAARLYGIRPVIEPMAFKEVRSLRQAVRVAERAGGGVLIDSLHFQRCGETFETLAQLDPDLLPYVQICDALLTPPATQPVLGALPRGQSRDGGPQLEARALRLLPGEGELPLGRLLAALPGGTPLSVEAPHTLVRDALTATDFALRARRAVAAVCAEDRIPDRAGQRWTASVGPCRPLGRQAVPYGPR